MSSKPTIAFAGLGAMGFGMAAHLVKSGFLVTGYDIFLPSMERFIALGGSARTASSPDKAVLDASFFICMVANSTQIDSLLFDPSTGAAKALSKDIIVAVCSTVAPAYIFNLRSALDEMGRVDVRLLDCPVSGGAGRAAAGSLSVFSSGASEDLDIAHEVLKCMSQRLYSIPGGLGFGSKAKLIHQVFAGVNIAMSSEAMGLAALAGMNTKLAFKQLGQGEGGSWMFEHRVPYMLSPGQGPYSAISIIAKDVRIITSTGRAERFPLPMVGAAEQVYLSAISAGLGGEDDCEIVRVYLPGKADIVSKGAGADVVDLKGSLVTIETIMDLMVGVHLAGVSEAMRFCEQLKIDTDLMFDIVSNAAGASKIFLKTFDSLRRGRWSLKAVPGAENIRDNMVSIQN